MDNSRNRKLLVIVIAVLVLVPLIIWLIYWLTTGNKVTVNIGVTPKDSYLTLDGQQIQPGQHTVTKGEHTLFASHQYFADATLTFNTANTNPKQTIYIAPDPNTPEAQQWLNDHPEDMNIWQIISGREFDRQQEQALDKYPVIQVLPRNTIDWRIDYVLNEGGSVTFTITTKPYGTPGTADYDKQIEEYKKSALKFLATYGVTPENSDIQYKTLY